MDINLKTLITNGFGNTALGFLRIRKNLGINHYTDKETEGLLRKIISSTPLQDIETKGKNHYFKCVEYNSILTINSYTLTIITAKKLKKSISIFSKQNKDL